MKAYLIDPERQEVTEVEHDDSLNDIKELLQCHTFDVVRIEHSDAIYVDDEGLYRQHAYFMYDGIRAPLAGRGLVLGTDCDGYTTEPVHDLQTITDRVKFITYEEALDVAKRLDEEGRKREQEAKTSGGIGYIYVPIAGILESAAYTDSSD